MDYNTPRRGGRAPEQRQTAALAPAPSPAPQPAPTTTQRKPIATNNRQSPVKWIVIALVVVALLALLWFGWKQMAGASGMIDRNKYQAVFLTNGQVYFGKLQNSRGDYLVLNNIFYLQASNAEGENSENPQETEADRTSGDVQLIKLGTEVHGPTDEMVISREQVLFFENLKDDGNVSQSIKQYYESQSD